MSVYSPSTSYRGNGRVIVVIIKSKSEGCIKMNTSKNKSKNTTKDIMCGGLLLAAGVSVLALRWETFFIFQREGFIFHSTWAIGAAFNIFLAVLLLMSAGYSLLRKNLPLIVKYLLVVATIGNAMAATFYPLQMYQSRYCDTTSVNSCPHIYNELILYILGNIVLYTIGGLAIYKIHKSHKIK